MTFKLHYIISCLLLYANIGYCQSKRDYSELDQQINYSYDALINHVKSNYEDKNEIALFFYYWIANNISYDQEYANILQQGESAENKNSPLQVFKSKTGICNGFATLYKLFLNEFEIECEVIDGYSKSKEGFVKEDKMLTLHSWNAFQIDDEWHLVDPTWGSTSRVNEKVTDYYFKTPAHLFLYDHFPLIEYWQLIQEPITLNTFLERLEIDAAYFELGFKYVEPKLEIVGNQCKLIIGRSKKWKPVLLKSNTGELYEPVKTKNRKSGEIQEIVFEWNEKDEAIIRLDAYHFRDMNEKIIQSNLLSFVLK